MIIEIPGRSALDIRNIVLDYNGTLANNGTINENVKNKLLELAKYYELYVLTADTYGSAAKECADMPVALKTFPQEGAGLFKKKIVEELNPAHCACLGNGFNDVEMLTIAALSIGVVGTEGMFAALAQHADILICNIEDGLDLFLNTKKIVATLRS